MWITRLEIRNYKMLEHVVIEDMPRCAVLVGRNATGKSTLLDALLFLKEAFEDGPQRALERRGGLQAIQRGAEGLVTGFEVTFGREQEVLFVLELVLRGGEVHVERESTISGDVEQSGFTPRKVEKLYLATVHSALPNQMVQESRPGEGVVTYRVQQWPLYHLAQQIYSTLTAWRFVGIISPNTLKISSPKGNGTRLLPDFTNLAAVCHRLKTHNVAELERISDLLRTYIKDLVGTITEEIGGSHVNLLFEFKDNTAPVLAQDASDGTVWALALLVLMNDPNNRNALLIDELEHYLSPETLPHLGSGLRAYARSVAPVVVATHSPEFLDGLELEDVIVVDRRGGATEIRRPEDHPVLRDLAENGEPPGALLRTGELLHRF